MYSLLQRVEKIRRTLPMMLSLYTFGALGICTLVMTIAREIFLFLAPPEYLAGIGLLGIMQFRWLFTMGVYVIDPGTAKSGKTWWVSLMLGLAVAVNTLANLLLTPRLGLYGAVISELLGYVTAMVGRWLISNRLFQIAWNYRYFLLVTAAYGLTAWFQTRVILSDLTWGWSFLARLLPAAGFFVFSWLLLDRESKTFVTTALKPVWDRLRRRKPV